MGAVTPASTTLVSGHHQTGPAPSWSRLTQTSQLKMIIRSRQGSVQLRLRPCCWTRRNVSDPCTARKRVSWSVSRLSSGPAAPGTPCRPGNSLLLPQSSLSCLILSRHSNVESILDIMVRQLFFSTNVQSILIVNIYRFEGIQNNS